MGRTSAAIAEAPRIIWAPQPGSQEVFLACPVFEALYDGTRGPGKTDALLMDFAQDVGKGLGASWKGVLFREESTQLEDVISKSLKWFSQMFPEARYIGHPQNKWVWPTGEQLLFRHMRVAKDYWKYHGHEYPWIGWEELTNWATAECYDSMKACCRSSDPRVPRKYRASCNPFGVGHHWVKARFVDPAPAGVPVQDKSGNWRVRIHGRLAENKFLVENDPQYVRRLEAIEDENKRKAWLDGSWDIIAGGFFDRWDRDKHVVKPFTIPEHWLRFASFDWGYARPFSVGWWSVASEAYEHQSGLIPRGAMIRYREWYGKSSDANEGIRMDAEDVADGIAGRTKEKLSYSIADPSIFSQDGGPSIGERMAARGAVFRRADNKRVSRRGAQGGWDQMRARMRGEDDRPMIYCFESCIDSIRTIPVLIHDENNLEDLDSEMEDHAADEWRYACMSRPYTRPSPVKDGEYAISKTAETWEQMMKRISRDRDD